jgi:acetolactate synthase-1/2/3 large subunit
VKYSGAEIIIKMLEINGIKCLSGIPGGSNLPLYDALKKSRIRHVLARHEQGAGFIAQGIARVTGKPGVCFATSGPGATNLLTAIADAKMDSVPLIAITGQVPSALIGTDAFQEVDTYGLSLSITKHSFLVKDVKDIIPVMADSFRIASSGRPGPVLIDVTKDAQIKRIEIKKWPAPSIPESEPSLPDDVIIKAADMINRAERPLLYIGGGIVSSGAGRLLRTVAEKAGIPVAVTLMGLGQ